MNNEKLFEDWGVTCEEVSEEITASVKEVLQFVLAEAKILKTIKSHVNTKIITILSYAVFYFLCFIKDNNSTDLYEAVVENVKNNFDLILGEHFKILKKEKNTEQNK